MKNDDNDMFSVTISVCRLMKELVNVMDGKSESSYCSLVFEDEKQKSNFYRFFWAGCVYEQKWKCDYARDNS